MATEAADPGVRRAEDHVSQALKGQLETWVRVEYAR